MPITYPLDVTGIAPTNHVSGEIQTFGGGVRAIVPNAGPFFTQGLTLRKASDNSLLMPNVDYKALHLYRDAVQQSGKEVCSVLYMMDPAFSGDVVLDYQCIGGDFSATVSTIQDLINTLSINGRAVTWGMIIDLPQQFPPIEHLQDFRTLYGADDIVAVLEGIRQAILLGDQNVTAMIYAYIQAYVQNNAASQSDLQSVEAAAVQNLISHINAGYGAGNAHKPDQVGLGQLVNWPVGNTTDHVNGSTQRYATTAGVRALKDLLTISVQGGIITGGGALSSTTDKLTWQLTLNKSTQTQAQLGTDDTSAMTPLRTKDAIAALAPAAIPQATETTAGKAAVANQNETNGGADDTKIVTPKKLRFGFQATLAATGGIVFPTWLGGLTFNWGRVNNVGGGAYGAGSASVSFTYTVASAFFGMCTKITGGNNVGSVSALSNNSLTIYNRPCYSDGNSTNNDYYWFMIGKT